jgi:hypothetical protein
LGVTPPVGCHHHKPNGCRCRRPRPRMCLRKGCGRRYTPRRWNQRYCQDPECLRLVRRWQAARRQAKRRQAEAIKARHAQDQRARRRRAKSSTQPSKRPHVPAPRGHAEEPPVPAPRGHAAKIFSRLQSASGRDVSNRLRSRVGTRPSIAVGSAAKLCIECSIASVSGGSAVRSKAVATANGNTRLPAPGTAARRPIRPAPHRRGRNRHDR